jgi:hypothetical protein
MREFHAKCVKIYRLPEGDLVIFRAFSRIQAGTFFARLFGGLLA